MIKNTTFLLARLLTPIWIAVFLLTSCRGPQPQFLIQDPYASVDWDRHGRYKANFHTHTTMSDGAAPPEEVIDGYRELGYAILAITDHDTLGPGRDREHPERSSSTWPWQKYGRNPEALGMFAVQGNEISRVHHMGSYFNDYGDAEVKSEQEAIEEIGRRGGLAMLFHPGRYKRPVEWYVDMYRRYDHLVGLEVYNQGDRYPEDRKTWDAILTEIMPTRAVWGFSNDDMHSPETQLGRNWSIMLLPELSADWVRRAMKEGLFYFVYAPEGHDGPTPPVIRSVTVDARAGTIEVQASGHDSVEWISEGKTVHQGERLSLADLPEIGIYFRAAIHGPGGTVAGTQPFRVRRTVD